MLSILLAAPSEFFKMATFVNTFQKHLFGINWNSLKPLLQTQSVTVNSVRSNHMFDYLATKKEHKEDYEYEISNDPEEWKIVEKLLPLETVPVPSVKPSYPSGWRPPSDKSYNHPYYVERSKNHMLPVYLGTYKQQGKLTKVKNIRGDIWKLHNELKELLEKERGKVISSLVSEGNNMIMFKGDFVYYCEQWLLSKGF